MFLAVNLFQACQQEAVEQVAPKVKTDLKANDRSCASGYCEFTVQAAANVTLEFCGDITSSVDDCDFGCNSLGDDRYSLSMFDQFNPVTYCVATNGSICIRNPSTATSNAVLQVKFGSSTLSTNVTLPPGVVRCFYSDSNCGTTNQGCI
ncbi:MAG: hypothetical protein ABMA02_05385 [Saprospiraceae bacterium]